MDLDQMAFIINIPPRTKKNSQQIITIKGRPMIIPSKLYKDYEKASEPYIPKLDKPIDYAINLRCIYYMPTKRRVDLNNLLEATTDMLVHYKFLEDDNSKIVYSHDGSRVRYDKEYPRTEIYVERIREVQQ